MSKLIHKKWLSIPVTVFLVLILTVGAVFASGIPPVNQILTQTINAPDVVYDYGSIEVTSRLNLPDIEVGESFSNGFEGTIIVEVGPDGAGMWLHMTLDPVSAALYDSYDVSLVSKGHIDSEANPMDAYIGLSVHFGWPSPFDSVVLEASVQLTEAGTYTFNENVRGFAGDEAGTADVFVTYTLENEQ